VAVTLVRTSPADLSTAELAGADGRTGITLSATIDLPCAGTYQQADVVSSRPGSSDERESGRACDLGRTAVPREGTPGLNTFIEGVTQVT
jgi:hypothetical protein